MLEEPFHERELETNLFTFTNSSTSCARMDKYSHLSASTVSWPSAILRPPDASGDVALSSVASSAWGLRERPAANARKDPHF
jgi:hypothetical protein